MTQTGNILDDKPTLLTKAIMRIWIEVEEVADKWDELRRGLTSQDLGQIAAMMRRIEMHLSDIPGKVKTRVKGRGLEFRTDNETVIVMPRKLSPPTARTKKSPC